PALVSTTMACLKMPSSAFAAGRVTTSLMPPGGNALMMVIGREGKTSSAAAPRIATAAAAAAPPTTKWRRSMLTLHASHRLHGRLDPLGVGVPEGCELRLIHEGNLLADIRHCFDESLIRRGLLRGIAPEGDDILGRALGSEQSDP